MLVGDDEVRAAGQNAQSTIGAQVLRWPQPSLYPPRNFGQVRVQQSGVLDNVAYLVDYLLARNEGPVLCVCSSKAETRGLAAAVAARLGPVSALTPGLGRIVSRVQSRRPFLRSLSEDVQCGVAYHNAGVPGDVRELIEAGVRDSEIRVVTATTTLAEGVDLPFRFTVLVDWLVWSDGHQKPMDPLLFRNIAGRSGRAGVYTEGDTYIFDNVVGAYEYTNTQVRRRFQTEVFASDSLPPLRSTLTEEGDGLSRAGEAILASQLLAAIPESGAVDDLSSVFADRSYAGATGSASALLQRLRHIESDITDRELGALATAASPLQLTDFGRAGNLTGMSPGACRRVVAVVPGIMGLNGVGALGATLVRDLADIPEQTNAALRKRLLGGSSRYLVASEDLEPVLNGWVSGAGEEELFLELGYVARSSRRPKAREWLELGTVSHTWHEEFDKFLEFLEGCVIGFLPWVLTACAILQPFSSPASGAAVEWELLSGMFETGTDSEWAVRAVRAGAPGSRMSIAKVGRSWPADMEFPEGRRLRGVMREQRVERVSGVFRAVRSSLSGERKGEELGAELEQLQAWVVDRL
jgi:helicase